MPYFLNTCLVSIGLGCRCFFFRMRHADVRGSLESILTFYWWWGELCYSAVMWQAAYGFKGCHFLTVEMFAGQKSETVFHNALFVGSSFTECIALRLAVCSLGRSSRITFRSSKMTTGLISANDFRRPATVISRKIEGIRRPFHENRRPRIDAITKHELAVMSSRMSINSINKIQDWQESRC